MGQSVLQASGHMYIGLDSPHVPECPSHLLGTYVRLQRKLATGCNGVLCNGHLWDGSCSEGASRSLNQLCRGALSALCHLEGFLDATMPCWELPPE